MLDALIRVALRQRLLVLAVAVVVLGAGIWATLGLPIDVFPDLNRPTVTILSEAGGLSPEEVEVQVTRPLEAALNGAAGVERVRSSSAVGLSIVWVEFGWSTDPLVNRQLVAERLSGVQGELPSGVTPHMGPLTSIMGEIMLVGLVADPAATPAVTPSQLRTLADFNVRQQLQAVRGVAQVVTIGGGREIVRVALDDRRLAALEIGWDEVAHALQGAQDNTTGGFLDRQNQEWLVRNLARTAGLERAVARLGETVVALRDGVPIRLDQVAALSIGPDVMRGDAGVNGRPAVILSVHKQPGASTLELTRAIDDVLAALGPTLPAGIEVVPLFRQAEFIANANDNVEHALRDGAILVVIVLLLFLQNLRTTFITLTAIPLSLAVTALVFDLIGLGVNTMTLGGVAVAIGELVDDAIVDVENVFRRLRENRASATPRPTLQVVWEASVEVRGSIVFATAIVILVFVPLFALSGIEGRLFMPLGIAYIVSIIASLIVSLTVTPVLASLLLPRARTTAHTRDGLLVRALKHLQRAVLTRVLGAGPRPFVVLGLALTLVVLAVGALPSLGREFLPSFNEGTATINLAAAPGTSLATSNALGAAAERLLLAVPEVKSVGRRTGRAEADEHAEGVHYSEIDVDFHADGRAREEVLAEIREHLAILPGVAVNLGQPISHRLDHLLSGVRAQIAVKVFGHDLQALRASAARIDALARSIEGLVDVQVEKQVLIPQVQIRVVPERAARYGLTPGALSAKLEALLAGGIVAQVIDGNRLHPVRVRLADDLRADVRRLGQLMIAAPGGGAVPLDAVAEVSLAHGPNQIVHDEGLRRIVVSANVQGRDLGRAVSELERAVASLELPDGQHVAFEGQFKSQEEATALIGWLSVLSLAGMVLVLWMHFRSLALVLQVLVNVPLALIGSVAALMLAELPLSVATLVGFITLCGIAARNSILLVDHYLHLVRGSAHQAPMGFCREAILRGSSERLVPVLMTALTAALALIPLALSADEPGREILHPVAVVILGGLVSSTLLDLLVTPAAFWLYGRRASEAARRSATMAIHAGGIPAEGEMRHA